MIDYRIVEGENICVFTGRGDVHVDDIKRTEKTAMSDERWQDCRRILHDYRGAVLTGLDFGTLHAGAARDRTYDATMSGWSLAVVASEDSAYGLMRMWKTMSEGRPVKVDVFRTLDEALVFLGVEDASTIGL